MPGLLRIGLERMMPRLQAEEELALASAVAAGSGNLDRREARKWLRDRRTAMQGGRRVRRPKSWAEQLQMIRAAGFHVRVEGEDGEAAAS